MSRTRAPHSPPPDTGVRAPIRVGGGSLDGRALGLAGRIGARGPACDCGVNASAPGAVDSTPAAPPSVHRVNTLPRYRLFGARRRGRCALRAGGALLSRQDELHAEDAVARQDRAPMLALFARVVFTQIEAHGRPTDGGAP